MSVPVLGIDPSLTATGLALLDGTRATVGLVRSVGRRADSVAARSDRIRQLADGIADWLPCGPSLVVVEGPSYGSAGGAAWDRAGLWHTVVARALHAGALVAVVAPGTRAKWATGSGKSDKAAVAAAAAHLLPDVTFTQSDEADAAILALMGAQRIGLRLQSKTRGNALAAVSWPDGLDDLLVDQLPAAS